VRDIVVFSGRAHPKLAKDICRYLDSPLSPTSVTRFSNDCLQVQLNANCREADVYIVQPLTPPVHDHLMELLQMLDAARGASAARTTAVIPYYGYSRSDKKDAPRISIAGRLVADLLETAGADRVLTMTLHAPQVHGFFGIPVDHLNALNVFARHFEKQDLGDAVVVSPDLGRAKDAAHLAQALALPVAAGSKRRLSDETVIIDSVVGEVEGRRVIVLDDEIANGGTMKELLDQLEQRQGAPVHVACTHGLFMKRAVERLASRSEVVEFVMTDTVPWISERQLPNLSVLSIAPLLAETIRRIHEGQSVSSLFSEPEFSGHQ